MTPIKRDLHPTHLWWVNLFWNTRIFTIRPRRVRQTTHFASNDDFNLGTLRHIYNVHRAGGLRICDMVNFRLTTGPIRVTIGYNVTTPNIGPSNLPFNLVFGFLPIANVYYREGRQWRSRRPPAVTRRLSLEAFFEGATRPLDKGIRNEVGAN